MSLEDIGRFHVEVEQRAGFFQELKSEFQINELMYLSTCNRVEFVFYANMDTFSESFEHDWLSAIWARKGNPERHCFLFESWVGINAAHHLFEVVSSLDSLVVGEREIITQVRNAFEESRAMQLSGDFIRLLMRRTIECGKRIYTETGIATNPVSVVSLAFHTTCSLLSDFKPLRIAVVGTGQTNTNYCRFLWKAGARNFHFFNRTLQNAQKAAQLFSGEARSLSDLETVTEPFDLIVSCTGADHAVIHNGNYKKLIHAGTVGVDLAVPSDYAEEVVALLGERFVDVSLLKRKADENLAKRKSELERCNGIVQQEIRAFDAMVKERKIENSLCNYPAMIQDLSHKVLTDVFGKRINDLDESGKELVEEVVAYLEKKYIGLPYKVVKEVLLNKPYKK